MKEIISRNLKKLEKKEQKILGRKDGIIDKRLSPIVGKIESKMPDMMRNTLDAAFYKSFELVFQNGTKYIEKLYNKEKIKSNHSLNDYKLSMEVDRKSIKELDRHARNSKILNSSISAVEGAGLGFIGMGLPDIPLFTAMILKTIYEISLSYGYEYELDSEKVYILNLICAALTRGESQIKHNARVDEISRKIDSGIHAEYDMKREISAASKILSYSMLTSKFVQGIPVVGAIGSITNYAVINKISRYSTIKYKKRYLNKKS